MQCAYLVGTWDRKQKGLNLREVRAMSEVSFLSFSGESSSKFLMGAMESGMEASDCRRWFRKILASGSGSGGICASYVEEQ